MSNLQNDLSFSCYLAPLIQFQTDLLEFPVSLYTSERNVAMHKLTNISICIFHVTQSILNFNKYVQHNIDILKNSLRSMLRYHPSASP